MFEFVWIYLDLLDSCRERGSEHFPPASKPPDALARAVSAATAHLRADRWALPDDCEDVTDATVLLPQKNAILGKSAQDTESCCS